MGVLHLKDGVTLDPIAAAGGALLYALAMVAQGLKQDITITSGTDGEHSGPTDPHKLGEAYDVRSKDLTAISPNGLILAVLEKLKTGPYDYPTPTSGGFATSHFFGFLESPDTPNTHIHFQRRKNTTFPE